MSVSNHPFIKVGNHVRFYLLNIRKTSAKRWPASFEDGQCLFFGVYHLIFKANTSSTAISSQEIMSMLSKISITLELILQSNTFPDEDFRVKG